MVSERTSSLRVSNHGDCVNEQGRQDMWEQWLRCRILKGMFSDELAVSYPPRAGTSVASVFVPRDYVEGKIDEEGKVRVKVFREGDTAWAVLPSPQRLMIAVDEADLLAL